MTIQKSQAQNHGFLDEGIGVDGWGLTAAVNLSVLTDVSKAIRTKVTVSRRKMMMADNCSSSDKPSKTSTFNAPPTPRKHKAYQLARMVLFGLREK